MALLPPTMPAPSLNPTAQLVTAEPNETVMPLEPLILAEHPDTVAEEQKLIESECPFPAAVRAVLGQVRERMPLDFFGMDFGVTQGGEVVLFEGGDFAEGISRQVCGLFQGGKRNGPNLVGLADFFERPADARVAREAFAAVG